MSLSISSSSGYADFGAISQIGGGADREADKGGTGAATSADAGATSVAQAQSTGGTAIQSNSVSPTDGGGSASLPPPPSGSGRGQLLDIAA
jgi:hypothetical protein